MLAKGKNASSKTGMLQINTTNKRNELIALVPSEKECHNLKNVHFEEKRPES